MAVAGAEAREFFAQRRVIRTPVAPHALADLVGRRCPALAVHRRAAELQRRAQAGGVLARVQRGVVGRTVEIDHVARIARHQHRCAQFTRERVQPRHMPVGVGYGARRVGHARGDGGRDFAAVVRQADQQRRGAAMESVGVGGHSPVIPNAVRNLLPSCRRIPHCASAAEPSSARLALARHARAAGQSPALQKRAPSNASTPLPRRWSGGSRWCRAGRRG